MDKSKAIDRLIKKTLFNILKEESESDAPSPQEPTRRRTKKVPPGTISTAGAFGSGGRAKKFVSEAGARADADPEGLLEDLGIVKKATGSDLDAALEILQKAIHSNIVMSEAYAGAKKSSESVGTSPEKQKTMEVVSITLGKIDRKNGVRFLAYTLEAAKNAGYLELDAGLQFSQSAESDIIVYSI